MLAAFIIENEEEDGDNPWSVSRGNLPEGPSIGRNWVIKGKTDYFCVLESHSFNIFISKDVFI